MEASTRWQINRNRLCENEKKNWARKLVRTGALIQSHLSTFSSDPFIVSHYSHQFRRGSRFFRSVYMPVRRFGSLPYPRRRSVYGPESKRLMKVNTSGYITRSQRSATGRALRYLRLHRRRKSKSTATVREMYTQVCVRGVPEVPLKLRNDCRSFRLVYTVMRLRM